MKQKYVDARAQQVYETYCDVWQKQGQVKSADFVRAVFARAIKAAIRARAGAIAGEFLRFATRTSFPAKSAMPTCLHTGLRCKGSKPVGRGDSRLKRRSASTLNG